MLTLKSRLNRAVKWYKKMLKEMEEEVGPQSSSKEFQLCLREVLTSLILILEIEKRKGKHAKRKNPRSKKQTP